MPIAALGIDLGSAAIKATLLDDRGSICDQRKMPAKGLTAGCLSMLLQDIDDPLAVGVTGGGKSLFTPCAGLSIENDLVATARAATLLYPGTRGIIEVGAHQTKWSVLSGEGEILTFSLNDQCAAGSGAFLVQQAARLQLSIEDLASLAATAQRPASIAGRCAVFAKSDMIHQQQKGTPPEEIAYGLCRALARNYRATLLRGGELEAPALFVGGGALNDGLYRAFLDIFGLSQQRPPLRVPDAPQFLASFGVAHQALERGRSCDLHAVLARITQAQPKLTEGPPALVAPTALEATSFERRSKKVSAYLGVDVGSVSTNLCLVAPGGAVIDGIYLRTKGQPVAVLREGLALLEERFGDGLDLLGVGTTGSGRHLAGKLLGADVIKNEITCQLLGAQHVVPDVDTILEIGGQDSKFVSVQDGRIVDFVMNKICAAGTGSFLEEQADLLGVVVEEQFADLALSATEPAVLGSQCTVFMDTEIVRAEQRGRSLPDILAGLAISVAKNYLERVVCGRPIGERVVFQGGVASNRAVVAAFEQLLGQTVQAKRAVHEANEVKRLVPRAPSVSKDNCAIDVEPFGSRESDEGSANNLNRVLMVHPYNGISGAIGAAVAAERGMVGKTLFRGLGAARSVAVKTFECKACSNLCQVSRVAIGEQKEKAYFGDVCERYTAGDALKRESTASMPDLFREVEEELLTYVGATRAATDVVTVGIPRAVMMLDLFPFWSTLLQQLGFKVILSDPSTNLVLKEGIKRLTAETCLPIKLAYGHVAALLDQKEVDFVFMPSILDLPDCADEKSHLCPYEESVGFMVQTFADRLVVPAVSMMAPRSKLVSQLKKKLEEAGYSFADAQLTEAAEVATNEQRAFQERLLERGNQIRAEYQGPAFAILGKPYNTLDAFQNLNLGQHLKKLGILPVPMQMLPHKSGALEATIPWRYNRGILRTIEALANKDLPVVIVSSFGCGPDAFAMKHVEAAARNTPHLCLEFDEHRGEAGLITRLEAFIDEVASAKREKKQRQRRPIAKQTGPLQAKEGRRFVLPFFADHAWAYAGALRFAGHEAVILPPPDEETLACGEATSSGRECHPYVVTAGDLVKFLDNGFIRDGDVFFFPGTAMPCLLHEYESALKILLERRGVHEVSVLSMGSQAVMDVLGLQAAIRLGRGMMACDLLGKLRCQVRPYAADPAAVDALFEEGYPRLADRLAEDQLGEALEYVATAVDALPLLDVEQRPIVGIAGDAYTRIHPGANHGLFHKLEALGLEVWPAPFFMDVVEFGWRRDIARGIDEGRYWDSFSAGLLFLRKQMEEIGLRFSLRSKVERASEPGYQEVLDSAAPYVDREANDLVILNIGKMVDFAKRGAHGVINAISFNCMVGTVSAALTDRIRNDYGMIPITTMVYSGKSGSDVDAKLEAFAHQVKTFAAKERPNEQGWLASLWR